MINSGSLVTNDQSPMGTKNKNLYKPFIFTIWTILSDLEQKFFFQFLDHSKFSNTEPRNFEWSWIFLGKPPRTFLALMVRNFHAKNQENPYSRFPEKIMVHWLFMKMVFVSYTVPARLVVSEQFFSKTALRIFLILCMKVPYYKSKKCTRPFFRKNTGSLIIHENVAQKWLFLSFFDFEPILTEI